MSVKSSRKIDSFYLVFFFVVAVLAALAIFTFRGLFSVYITAFEGDLAGESQEVRIDRAKLDEAVKAAYENQEIELVVE